MGGAECVFKKTYLTRFYKNFFHSFSDHCADSEDEENNTALWMTATQFSQMLDKQEATMDSQSVQQQPTNKQKLNKSSPVKTKTKSQNQNKNDLITTSFLDQEAMIPFKKLRQVKKIFL